MNTLRCWTTLNFLCTFIYIFVLIYKYVSPWREYIFLTYNFQQWYQSLQERGIVWHVDSNQRCVLHLWKKVSLDHSSFPMTSLMLLWLSLAWPMWCWWWISPWVLVSYKWQWSGSCRRWVWCKMVRDDDEKRLSPSIRPWGSPVTRARTTQEFGRPQANLKNEVFYLKFIFWAFFMQNYLLNCHN